MSAAGQTGWPELILSGRDASATWRAIFARLRDLALGDPGVNALHYELVDADRLLAESAWNLWESFPGHAPSVIDAMKQSWAATSPFGTAVLVLDALSLRELPLMVGAGGRRGIVPTRVEVLAAEVPTETDRFAAALGVAGRSKLNNNQAPASFVFGGPDVHTDVLDAPFADCVGSVSPKPRLFLWHTWPDDALIHHYEDKPEGPATVAEETAKQLGSDGFWGLVDRLRQGRRLVVTGDHGYAVSKWFSSEVKDEETIKLLRQTFGAKRCARENPDSPWPHVHLPPLVCRHNGWLVVMGQRKWKVQGGFPHLCHRGLTLLEAAVPFVEFPPA